MPNRIFVVSGGLPRDGVYGCVIEDTIEMAKFICYLTRIMIILVFLEENETFTRNRLYSPI